MEEESEFARGGVAGRLRMEDLFLGLRFLKSGAVGAVAVSVFSMVCMRTKVVGSSVVVEERFIN